MLHLLCLVFVLLVSTSSESLSPIIFVPGSFCSLLEVRINTTLQPSCPLAFHNQWLLLWLNLRLVDPTHLACFEQIFRFSYNASSNSFVDPPGVETRTVPRTSDASFLQGLLWEYVELEKFLTHFTRRFHYADGVNLRSMPYDFRRGNEKSLLTFTQNLKILIESTYAENSNSSVTLISHSTGGSMTLFFLSQQDQQWKDRYVRRWISLSGNIAGEVDNIQSVIQGFLSPIVSASVLQSWDFFAWRLPEPLIYGSERVLVQTPSRNYTSFQMLDLLQAMNATDLARLYPQASALLGSLPPPNVSTYCFFGANISTAVAYRSASDHFDDGQLQTIEGSGDGEQDDTTNMSCERWKETMDRKYTLVIKGFNRVNHLALVGDEEVLKEIDQIIG